MEERCTHYYLRADRDSSFSIATVWTMMAHFTTPQMNGFYWGVNSQSKIGHKLPADMQPEGSVGGGTTRNDPGHVARLGRSLAHASGDTAL